MYHVELSATPGTWLASVAWEYPQDMVHMLRVRGADMQASVEEGITLDRLRFRYAITGDEPSWRPLRAFDDGRKVYRSEEHTSELQSLMRISYAVFCLKKKKTQKNT